jgi:superfamily II DNA/RNA helicase
MTHLHSHTTVPGETKMSFADLGVRDEIVRALAENGIEHAFAIQELTLPLALAGDDLIGQARTGMGKTFAFGVPLLHRIATDTEHPPADRRARARWSWSPPASCASRCTATSRRRNT